MSKIPTAEEFSMDIEFVTEHDLVLFNNIYKYAIEFAKLHAVRITKKLSKTEEEYQRNINYIVPFNEIK